MRAPAFPKAVILVGHGVPPRGYPRDKIARLKALEGRRRETGGPMSDEEAALDRAVRAHPRAAGEDPYQEGLEALAAALRPKLGGASLRLAYNEFCAPTLEEAVEQAAGEGAREVVVVPSMLTPGGVHAEVEIPESIAALRTRWPDLVIRYAWPFDLDRVARLLSDHVQAPGDAAPPDHLPS